MERKLDTAGDVLCFLTETEMATLEMLKDMKSTSKSELRRHESIVNMALRNCEVFGLLGVAEKGRNTRVARTLAERVGQVPPNGITIYYTVEEATCHTLDCVYATLEHLQGIKRASKREIARTQSIIDTALKSLKKIDLGTGRQGGAVERIKKILENVTL
jgi:hypothetical protein